VYEWQRHTRFQNKYNLDTEILSVTYANYSTQIGNFIYISMYRTWYTVKTVYKGQPRGITKVAFADRWPLFRTSETAFPFSREN